MSVRPAFFHMKLSVYFIFLLNAIVLILSCGKDYTPEEKKYISEVEKLRAEKDDQMKNDPNSPFNQDEKAHFQPLKYFDPDQGFVFKSKLFEYNPKDTIIILGTKGEERKVVKYGYVLLNYNSKNYRVNVYNGVSKTGEEYYSIWFTDKTTSKETYGVGRYLDFPRRNGFPELNPDKDFVYTIDFNLAYNPYCSYSAKYSCAIPTKEDYIDIAIEAGEKNFH
jgi:uncharacterized protein